MEQVGGRAKDIWVVTKEKKRHSHRVGPGIFFFQVKPKEKEKAIREKRTRTKRGVVAASCH